MNERSNAAFEAWARFVIRYRWLVIALTLALTGLAQYIISTRLLVDTSLEAMVVGDDPAHEYLEELRDDFGRDDLYLILVEGDVFTIEYVERLRALHDELAALDMDLPSRGERKADRDRRRRGEKVTERAQTASPDAGPTDEDFGDFDDFDDFDDTGELDDSGEGWGDEQGGTIVDEIVSLINARRITGDDDGIVVGEWMTPMPTAAELPELERQIRADRALVDRIVGHAGKHSVITLRTDFLDEEDSNKLYHEIYSIARKHDAEGFRTYIAGLPALNASVYVLMRSDLERLLGLAFIAMLVVLTILFRHPIGVVAPIVVVGVSAVWTFAVMALVNMPMTVLTNVLPPFLICVGVGDAVHIQSVYRDFRKRGVAHAEALPRAVGSTGLPCLLTSVTTMIGLLSFNFAGVDSVREMGTAGAIGAFLAFIHSVTLLPALLSFNRKSLLGARSGERRDLLDRFIRGCSSLSNTPARRRVVLAVMVGLIGFSAYAGYTWRRVMHDPLSWMPEDDETVYAFDSFDEHLGGTIDMNLLVDPKTANGINNLELLRQLEQVDRDVLAYQHPTHGEIVGSSISILDMLRETNRALHNSDEESYRLPATQRGVSDQVLLLENSGRDQLRRMVTPNGDRAHLSYQVVWIDATAYHGLVDHVAASIENRVDPELAEVAATGSLYTVVGVVSSLLEDMLQSFGTAFAVITVLMILLLRSVKLGATAMVPNIMPVIVVLGIMGVAGVPIDINNLLIGSLVIGIAVDDTIHLLHHFSTHYRATGDVEASIGAALGFAGRAMVSTSVILTLGFAVYLGANMLNLIRFGALVSTAVVLAALIDLVFTPALLRAIYSRR